MRKKLRTDPRVVALAARLQRTRAEIIGGLFLLWCLGDEHGEVLRGMTKPLLDETVGIVGFSDALPSEWLQERVTSNKHGVTRALHLPKYVGHNATTERSRALTRERVRKHRAKKKGGRNGVTPLHEKTDQTRPDRDQKQNRREGNNPPTPREQTELRAYALEAVGLPRNWLVAVTDLLPDFSVTVAVGVLEHLASRRTTSRAKTFREIRKPAAFLKDLLVKVESGERPDDQGNSYEPFENWRARRAAEVA